MNHAVQLLVTLFKVVEHPYSLVHLICCVLFLSRVLKCLVCVLRLCTTHKDV